jgi:hypothetical protein
VVLVVLKLGQVLHATPSLNNTLRHVRKLLHPRGRLLLHELFPCGSPPIRVPVTTLKAGSNKMGQLCDGK